MDTVTQDYLDGIREGREHMNILKLNGTVDAAAQLAEVEAFTRKLAPWYGAEVATEFLRGERDFWRNQVRKLA